MEPVRLEAFSFLSDNQNFLRRIREHVKFLRESADEWEEFVEAHPELTDLTVAEAKAQGRISMPPDGKKEQIDGQLQF